MGREGEREAGHVRTHLPRPGSPHWFPGGDLWPTGSPQALRLIEDLNDNFAPDRRPRHGHQGRDRDRHRERRRVRHEEPPTWSSRNAVATCRWRRTRTGALSTGRGTTWSTRGTRGREAGRGWKTGRSSRPICVGTRTALAETEHREEPARHVVAHDRQCPAGIGRAPGTLVPRHANDCRGRS